MQVRIFYRNRQGKDNKIMGWTHVLDQAPPNEFQAAANITVTDLAYQATNTRGVALKKVIGGVIYDRAPADIATDINNKQFLYQDCEIEIAKHLFGKEKITWAGAASANLFEYLKALQTAAGIADNQLSAAGQQAKGTLTWIAANVNTPIQTAMTVRDAAIALLDVED